MVSCNDYLYKWKLKISGEYAGPLASINQSQASSFRRRQTHMTLISSSFRRRPDTEIGRTCSQSCCMVLQLQQSCPPMLNVDNPLDCWEMCTCMAKIWFVPWSIDMLRCFWLWCCCVTVQTWTCQLKTDNQPESSPDFTGVHRCYC